MPSEERSGSQWHRWDPHVHTPGTLLNDQFGGDWGSWLSRVESATPVVRALGVTDYFSIRAYSSVLEEKRKGRLANVDLIFPNVEIRLSLETEKKAGVNLHLLFSPEDPDHETQIARVLKHLTFEYGESKYCCDLEEFERLGRRFDASIQNREAAIRVGANQFKIALNQLRELFRSEAWLRENCLVAVAAGEDGTSGLQGDPSFKAVRREVERFADIIFSGQPRQRDYWLGRKPGFPRESIETTYKSLKPCLHGSDAHTIDRVLAPAEDRFCWIKGKLIFDSLRQVIVEPADRVFIGAVPPPVTSPSERIDAIRITEAPWFTNGRLELNPGLIAIIGARGSGKTALADAIARGAGAIPSTPASRASFLNRATRPDDLIGDARVELSWGDGTVSSVRLRPAHPGEDVESPQRVRYLSQQFVEELCSADGLGNELIGEIESVVFEAVDQTERLGATNFAELRDARVVAIQRTRDSARDTILKCGAALAKENAARQKLPAEQARRAELLKKIDAEKKELADLVPKGREERAKRLSQLEVICGEIEAKVEDLKKRRKHLDDLDAETQRFLGDEAPRRHDELREMFKDLALSDDQWSLFEVVYRGDVLAVTKAERDRCDLAIAEIVNGLRDVKIDANGEPNSGWPLSMLREERDRIRKEVGVDEARGQKYAQVKGAIAKLEAELNRVDELIAQLAGADERIAKLRETRRKAYEQVIETFAAEQQELELLYEPLRSKLVAGAGALKKLEFSVSRIVDTERWVKTGEALLDLRSAFRGEGGLRAAAEQLLVPMWKSGTPADVSAAVAKFAETYNDDLRKRPMGAQKDGPFDWHQRVGSWLYATSHIELSYGIRYDGVELERLSPGTRGIVLLILYLAIDMWDRRPIIVDQPEENLDPKSVFDELVGFFREARSRRQVIIVTHNANLVVNSDADQILVASATRRAMQSLPDIHYEAGALEDAKTRRLVCDLLEGGERAFRERDRRYRFGVRQ